MPVDAEDANPADDLSDRFRAAAQQCQDVVVGFRHRSPAEVFRSLADACDEFGIDEWDRYGESGPIEQLESELADLLRKPAAAFFPSGTMAQQAALRVWSDRAGTRRIALPDLSHLLHHELDGPRLMHGFEVEHLTLGATTPTAAHLAELPGTLAAVLVELPLRDGACLLPTWDELTELAEACRERKTTLHFDGARIWETAAAFGRPVSEVADLADSVYVSFYKGLGGLAGCGLAGPTDFVAEARRWRARAGGTIYRMTPEVVAAIVGLRDRLPLMERCLEWARSLTEALPDHVVSSPELPHISTFRLYAAGDPDVVNQKVIDVATDQGLLITGMWRASEEPGRIWTEIAVSADALELDPGAMANLIGELVS